MRRGAKITNLRHLDAKMYHTSANLTFGGGNKYLGTKSYRGRLKGEPKAFKRGQK